MTIEEKMISGDKVQYRFGRIYTYVGKKPYSKNYSIVYDLETDTYFPLPTESLRII